MHANTDCQRCKLLLQQQGVLISPLCGFLSLKALFLIQSVRKHTKTERKKKKEKSTRFPTFFHIVEYE